MNKLWCFFILYRDDGGDMGIHVNYTLSAFIDNISFSYDGDWDNLSINEKIDYFCSRAWSGDELEVYSIQNGELVEDFPTKEDLRQTLENNKNGK